MQHWSQGNSTLYILSFQVHKDFFGRIIKRKTPDEKPKKKVEEKKKNVLQTDIWFHFTEGFSNAVRRNVKVKDFLWLGFIPCDIQLSTICIASYLCSSTL